MIKDTLYPEYRAVRKLHPGMPAYQAFFWARGEIVRRCRNQLLPDTDPRLPDNVDDAESFSESFYFPHHGYQCALRIVHDDEIRDEEFMGFTVSRNINPYREPGWGHDGLDRGLYAVDTDTLVTFDETRQEVLTYAPKGMSKQMAYEWATKSMHRRLDYYRKLLNDDIQVYGVVIECEDLGIHEALWGIDVDVTDALSRKYLDEVVDELYDQFVYEFDKQKIVA